ncbi:MAG: hypothetical protein IJ859_12555 [Synergistaceae bacterium]|nr:hypothetical protein [Synergistaceae bacterium]
MPFLRAGLIKKKTQPPEPEQEGKKIIQPVTTSPVPVIPDDIDEIVEELEDKNIDEQGDYIEQTLDSEPATEESKEEIKTDETTEQVKESEIETQTEEPQGGEENENSLPEEMPEMTPASEDNAEDKIPDNESVNVEIEETIGEAPQTPETDSQDGEQTENIEADTSTTPELDEEQAQEDKTVEVEETPEETTIENENPTDNSEPEEAEPETDTTLEPIENTTSDSPAENVEEEQESASNSGEDIELKYDFTSGERYVDKVSTKTEFDKMLDELAAISSDLLSHEVEKFAKKYASKFQGDFEKSEADAKKYEAFLGGYITNAAMILYDNSYKDAAIRQLDQAKNILVARQKLEVETEAIKERVVEENAAVDLSDILGMFGDG